MTTWKFTTMAALASVMFAGPAFAQATTGSPAPATDSMKSDTMKSADSMKSDKKSSAMRDSRKRGMAMGDEQVKAAQQALKDKGHDPGMVDGRMGAKTQAAIRDFQKAQGIEATGRLDTKTIESLGMEAGKTGSAGSSATSGSASPTTTAPSDMKKTGDATKAEEKK